MRAFVVVFLSFFLIIGAAHADETFNRVLSKRELRCAYTIYPPFFIKDPNTGTFSGLFHDAVEEMGKQLSIKIVWTEEVGSDAIFEGLKTGRYDAVCVGYFAMPARANGGSFTKPVVYVPSYLYVRKGESRFKTAADLNKPEVTIATQDGEFSQLFKNEFLPLAKEVAMPGLTQAAERFETLAGGKADATVAEAVVGNEYNAKNPDKIERLGPPAHIGASVVILPHDAVQLREYLNAAIDTLLLSGATERIIAKYDAHGGAFLPPAKPYELK